MDKSDDPNQNYYIQPDTPLTPDKPPQPPQSPQPLNEESDIMERVQDQIAKGWLTMEREKSQLLAAIDNLSIGFMMIDDHDNVIKMNPALNRILGPAPRGKWTVLDMQREFGTNFNLPLECNNSIIARRPLPPKDVHFKNKKLRIFISPIILLKESIAVLGTTILIEDLAEAPQAA